MNNIDEKASWVCKRCTYTNQPLFLQCEMCQCERQMFSTVRPGGMGPPVGGMNRTGQFGSTGMRPATPSRQAGAGRQPSVQGTARAGAGSIRRMGTGMKPGTRMGTGMIQGIDSGMGSTAHVKVDYRPVTQQGLAMSTRPLGPRREVEDKSYFLAELNKKTKAIRQEIESMSAEIEQIRKDNAKFETMDQRRETLWNEVKTLEGKLADFNLAINRVRHSMPVEDFRESYNRVKEKNDAERRAIDQIFLNAAQVDSETKEIENALQNIYNVAADRMATLGVDAQEEYNQLKEEDKYLLNLIQNKEMEREHFDMTIDRYKKRLAEPEFLIHRRGIEMKQRKLQLESRHAALLEETQSNLSPEQLREKLKEKMNFLQSELETTRKTTKMTEDVTEQLNVDVSNKTDAVKDAQTHKRRAEKYEVLYAKDEKLQKFNDSYPKHKEEQVTQKKTLQRTIVMLLQHISKGLVNSSNLPDQAKFAEIKSELSFKESRVQHSKSTLGKLDAELQQKKAELNRINGLDKKISLELKAFKGKISDMKREAQTFKSTEDLHAEAKEVKSKLNAIKVEVSKKRDALKNQVQLLGHTLERKKRELNTNENAKRLDSLQTKLRAQTQNSFQLSEWIIARKREADWDSLRKQSVSLTSEINQAHIKCNRI